MTHRTNLFDFERDAEGVLDTGTFGYYYSGADDEVTKRENRAAFENVQLLPRMLVGVAERDTSTTVLGQKLGMPVVIAPMALAKMAHADGEPGMARAAADFGVPTALSTMSTTRLEDVAAAASAPMWFQLYVYKDRAITEHLVKRAEAAGYQAQVLTVDVPVIGNRERDVRNEFKVAAGIQLANLVDFALQDIPNEERDSALGKYISEQVDPSLAWRDVDWLASITSLPILVKGILRADDAQKALDHGAKGIVVSNHGGRQLDTAISTFNALQMIAPTVGDRMEILMDGGVRRGTDILKALALGAKAVMVGRPIMYGLAVGGESGVREVLRILHREFDAALALCGCRTVTDITPDLILR